MNHGTVSGYTGGCRCERCKSANREYKRNWVERMGNLIDQGKYKHGTVSTYHRGCRCDACRKAKSEYYKARYKTTSDPERIEYTETPEERKRSNDAWRRRFEVEWGLA